MRSALQKQCQHLHSSYKDLFHHELICLHSWKGDPDTSFVMVGELGGGVAQSTPERGKLVQKEFFL